MCQNCEKSVAFYGGRFFTLLSRVQPAGALTSPAPPCVGLPPAHSARAEQRRQAFISRASGAHHHYPGRRQATHIPVNPPHQPLRRNRRGDRAMMTKKVGGDVNFCSRVSPDFQSQRARGRAAPYNTKVSHVCSSLLIAPFIVDLTSGAKRAMRHSSNKR